MEEFMTKYAGMVGRLFDIRLKGSTTRLGCLVLIGTGIFTMTSGDLVGGAAHWALGAALWGIRDKQDS